MPPKETLMFLAGDRRKGSPRTIRCPYDGSEAGVAHFADASHLAEATDRAVAAAGAMSRLPPFHRADILRRIAAGIAGRAEELAERMALEAAKPIRQARIEVNRSQSIFAGAAEEAVRIPAEVVPMEVAPAGLGRQAILRRFPLGPVAAITPFNFPLNQVAHKLAPAIAAGCPLVLKPASQTPLSALALAEIAAESGLPEGGLTVLPLDATLAAPLAEDARFRMLTFTGSAEVGWDLKRRAGKKRVTLELGGNAAVIVHGDAEIDHAAERCVQGGFWFSGQSCISVQRILVHTSVFDRFLTSFLPRVAALKTGHPLDETSDLCSLISEKDGQRLARFLSSARRAGATVLAGGEIHGAVMTPTVITGARADLEVNCREVFAPLVTVTPYDDFSDALRRVNDSDFGLQAGVFTRDVGRIFTAFETLEVGGVMANEVPAWRLDPMPYGGVKDSGQGREGVRWAIAEMTEPRLLVIRMPEPER